MNHAAVSSPPLSSACFSSCHWNHSVGRRCSEQYRDLDEAVTSSWAQVESQYQRRADLIPNLVETVKGLRIRSRMCSSE